MGDKCLATWRRATGYLGTGDGSLDDGVMGHDGAMGRLATGDGPIDDG